MTVIGPHEQDWQTWHAQREADLNTDYGWLTVVAFNWLGSSPAEIPGLPGKWWAADGLAHVTAAEGLTASGEPVVGTTSASVAEAGSLSWLLYGDKLVELVLRVVLGRDERGGVRALAHGDYRTAAGRRER